MKTVLFGLISLFAVVQGCLLPHEHARDASIFRRQSQEEIEQYATEDYFAFIKNSSIPVASNKTDRFCGGSVAPRGLGSQRPSTTISEALNVVEIRSAVKGLVEEFDIEIFELPEKTHDGATMFGAKVGNGRSNDAYHAYLTAGTHARERSAPDGLIYFVSDLLWAEREGTGLVYGGRKYTNSDVNKALSAGLVFMPLVNPDGVLFDHNTNLCWRKNRNPDGPVDLNRNYDFLWNYTQYFAPGIEAASNDPDAANYYGTGPFSEPETRNVRRVLDMFKISWFMDIHTFADVVLYPWGDDENQVSDPEQAFWNPEYDGKRGHVPDEKNFNYSSYINQSDWDVSKSASQRMAKAMQAGNGGREVQSVQNALFYPTSGTCSDYAYSRALLDPSLTKVHAFGVEIGVRNEAMGNISCPFYPNVTSFNQNIRSMGAGLMEFLLVAAEDIDGVSA
ncbi:hypothetical protein FDECE_4038 [Fusarium decemcellulare]|nr:hypothetical protein FDECE_4038 [Fusarium decemcellulare]